MIAAVSAALGGAHGSPAQAATITSAYAVGHRQVAINGYGTQGLGTFVLRRDAGDPFHGERLALCIEADASHSTAPGQYQLVENRVSSPQLDYLLWKYGWPGTAEYTPLDHDHDTATALGALAWFYSDAERRHGAQVWSDPANGFAALTPASPHRWDALPTYTGSFPVGLRAGVHHLDAAERRVHELFLDAEARRGPWTLSPVTRLDGHATVSVSGPAGPIAEVGGVRFVVRGARGEVIANTVVRTDRAGLATAPVPTLHDGGSVEVSMFAPGVHQEWDGHGDVQRMSTATNATLAKRLEVAPTLRHVEVQKRSSDPLFGVAGARFALLDASGRTISAVTTGADGRAAFLPVDPAVHPLPYSIREVDAPPGLARASSDARVPDPSTQASRPTVIDIDNDPVEYGLRVRKELSDPRVGPGDRSGFEFEITRTDDDRSYGVWTTGHDGRSARLDVTAGTFRVCERSRPPWAEVLTDPGCSSIEIGPGSPDEVEVVYTNHVPEPWITTAVWPATMAVTGGALVDRVTYHDVVPGTEYVVAGEIQVVMPHGVTPSGITATTTFVPDRPTGTVEVEFEVPDRAGLDMGVVFQELRLADEVVATHTDPDAFEQTFWVPSIDTQAALTEHGLVDHATYRGLPPGDYEARVTWHERLADGSCRSLDLVASTDLVVQDHHGELWVGPVEIGPELLGTTVVAFHELIPTEHDDDHDNDGDRRPLAAHADCDAQSQTVVMSAPERSAPESTTTSTSTSTSTPVVTTEPLRSTTTEVAAEPTAPTTITGAPSTVPRRPLPATGQGVQLPTALALMAAGAGGLAVVAAAISRRRTW
ncbi:hypothetical protein BH23ACT3_BH23ACT3_10370 [soil metagenome]